MKLSTYFSLLNRRQWLKVLVLGTVAQTALGKAKPTARRRRKKTGKITTAARSATTPSIPRPTVAPLAAPTELATAAPPPQRLATLLTPSAHDSAIIPIRISDFPVLADGGGSVAIYFSNLRYPIVINRDYDGAFHALDPTCTHQGCQVENYNPDAFYMICECHGSRFMIDGRVAEGPALADLISYPTQFDGADLLEIELPGVPLRIDRVSLQSSGPGSMRLKLDFPGVSGCKYQVQYFANLSSPPQPTLFSLSAGGPATQSSFTVPQFTPGNPLSGDGTKFLWIDAPGSSGFFAIEMILGVSTPL